MVHSLCKLVPSLINPCRLFFFFFFLDLKQLVHIHWTVISIQYRVSRFDPRLMEKYNAWKAAGGTELNWDTLNDDDIDFTTPVNATKPLQSEVTNSPKETPNVIH